MHIKNSSSLFESVTAISASDKNHETATIAAHPSMQSKTVIDKSEKVPPRSRRTVNIAGQATTLARHRTDKCSDSKLFVAEVRLQELVHLYKTVELGKLI